jgi:hypothetical protein
MLVITAVQYTIETVLVVTAEGHKGTAMSAPERVSVPSGGVNAALFEYGDYVLSRHSKKRALGSHKTETEYLGYSTTAFYFYNLCDCLDVSSQEYFISNLPLLLVYTPAPACSCCRCRCRCCCWYFCF